jgi:two-component system, OmpR family, sensor kinase
VLLLAIVSFGIPLGLALRDRVDSEVRSQARTQADQLAAFAADQLAPADAERLATLALRQAGAVRGRVLVVDGKGVVIADSAGADQVGRSYAARPEIAAALRGRAFQDRRRSDTLDTDLLATAVPIVRGGRPAGAVRITQDVAAVDESVRSASLGLVLVAGLVLAIGLAAGIVIARRLSAPLASLEGTAREIADGDLERRAPIAGTSEQRSLARSFNEMTARLAGALRSQREFVADASHQLRTPLSGLRLRLEEARAARLPDDAAHEVDAALREVDRLSDTVDELLILSRAGERDAPAERLDLSELARSAAARWSAAAAERGMTVDVDADAPAPAYCARADVERALDVLVENALAYSGDGGTVTIGAVPGRVCVLDRGPGFADGEHEEVFQRFRRGSAARSGARGSGLGLPIARALMERWGGGAHVEDRDGGGAVAVLDLPREGDGRFTEALP